MVMRDAGGEDSAELDDELPLGEVPHLQVVDPDAPPIFPRLTLNKNGVPHKTLSNAIDLLSIHPSWDGVIAFDEFGQVPIKVSPAPTRGGDLPQTPTKEWTKTDSIRTVAWMQSQPAYHKLNCETKLVDQAVLAIAERNTVHPVRDWFDGLAWDGKQRLPSLFPHYFRADDSLLAQEAGKRWLISAVARIYEPGCQAKYMPVLESGQDMGKSTGIRALAGPEWYSDTGLMIGNKDSYQCLRAKLIHEFAELAAFKSAKDVESLKNFLSSPTDNYRRVWDDRNRDYPRQCVFIGTTNDERWISDTTGGSRFWPIRCRNEYVLRDELTQDREQLWAEAVARYKSKEIWHIDGRTEQPLHHQAVEQQDERTEQEPWAVLVNKWLERPTMPDPGLGGRTVLHIGKDGLAPEDVLVGALDMKKGDCDRRHVTRLGHVMRKLGFERKRVRVGADRAWRYFRVDVAPF